MFELEPILDRIVVKRVEVETRSQGGIVIPDMAAERPQKGEVVALGKGRLLESGEYLTPTVKVGDQIIFGKYSGNEIKIENESYLVMREEDIFAIIRGE